MLNRINNTHTAESHRMRDFKFRRIGEQVYGFFDDTAIANGYELRDGQLDMACEIVDAIKARQPFVVEAGVGIGKSFAYIVPALALIQEYGGPVVIATSTIALQEQLKDDVEKVMQMMHIRTDVLIAKGQSHFLCRKRCDEFFADDAALSSPELTRIRNVVTSYGKERADWKIGIPDNIWNRINVRCYNQRACKDSCPYYQACYYYKLRKEMLHSTGIIICNQDLLTADLTRVSASSKDILNPHKQLIIVDEAHNLEDKVRSSLTVSYSPGMIRSLLDQAAAAGIQDERIPALADSIKPLFQDVYTELLQQTRLLDRKADNDRMDRPGRYHVVVPKEATNLRKLIYRLKDVVGVALAIEMERKKARKLEDLYDALDDLHRHFLAFDRRKAGNDIFWAEKRSDTADGITLYRCPKHVASCILINYSGQGCPVILTSATLTSGKNPDYRKNYAYFAKSTGFGDIGCRIGEEKPSPFDYDRHAMIYYSNDMPHPTKEHDLFLEKGCERILDLLKISSGKALILFTSKRDMTAVYEYLKKQHLPFDLILQDGSASQKEILERFRRNTNSVLLGTGTFWEGINVEGISLSHLIVFRLPFPNPEPVLSYKVKQAEDGMRDVLVPEMIIRLKQGIGRLIRSETDTGIVSIIDPRIGDKANSPFRNVVWDSLPIKRKTGSLKELKAFYDSVCKKTESSERRKAS